MQTADDERGMYLGMTLFASSAVAGHRFAICAVSNCVKAGSRRSVLFVSTSVQQNV